MGIRIHKVMGYAITDLGEGDNADPKTFDKRLKINPNHFYDIFDDNKNATVKRMVAWQRLQRIKNTLTENEDEKFNRKFIEGMIRHSQAFKKNQSLMDFIHMPFECGIGDRVMLIQPVDSLDWYRYDDTMDYYNEYLLRDQAEAKGEEFEMDRAEEIEGGIYPYSGIFVDRRTGKRIDASGSFRHVYGKMAKELVAQGQGDHVMFTEDQIARWGITTAQEFLDNVVPELPDEIVLMCKYMDLFKDHNSMYDLRPTLITYWS